MRATLTIDVDYELSEMMTEDQERAEARRVLDNLVLHAEGEGLLGGDYLDIRTYTHRVHIHEANPKTPAFYIDQANTDDERIYVDVAGYGSVSIVKSPDGLAVDIYPFHVADEPAASCWADLDDLVEDALPVHAHERDGARMLTVYVASSSPSVAVDGVESSVGEFYWYLDRDAAVQHTAQLMAFSGCNVGLYEVPVPAGLTPEGVTAYLNDRHELFEPALPVPKGAAGE